MIWIAVSAGVLGLLAMFRLWSVVRGTTLAAPWCWAIGSALALLAVAGQGASEPLLNYAAAVTTLLPAAAIYGAKRPQDRGWQWIVAALLVMLLWPAGECWLLEQPFDLTAQPLRAWFLVVLLVVQLGNWIVTLNAGPVLLMTAAQVLLLWPQLPWTAQPVTNGWWLTGASLLAVVPWWLRWNTQRAGRVMAIAALGPFPAPREFAQWQQFRASYGVVWALRVTERINEVARLRRWPWQWTWSGPTPNAVTESATVDLMDPAERRVWAQLWPNIFRRFLNTADFSAAESIEPDVSQQQVSAR